MALNRMEQKGVVETGTNCSALVKGRYFLVLTMYQMFLAFIAFGKSKTD